MPEFTRGLYDHHVVAAVRVTRRALPAGEVCRPGIGRGTRLYDGRDYSTIHDFVKAHHVLGECVRVQNVRGLEDPRSSGQGSH